MVVIGRALLRRLMVGSLVLLTVGCGGTASRLGGVSVTFDGMNVGGGGSPSVDCRGTMRLEWIMSHHDRFGYHASEWYPDGIIDEPEAGLSLRLRPDGDPPASVTFRVGEAVYRSNDDTVMTIDGGWSGRATFTDLPLVSGEADGGGIGDEGVEGYQGRDVIHLLDIRWDCPDR